MAATRGSRRRRTRYYVLRRDGHEPSIARVTARGSSAVYDPASRSWVNDPLLAATIRITDDWVPATPGDLPDGLEPTTPGATGRRPRRWRRGGGRHQASPGS